MKTQTRAAFSVAVSLLWMVILCGVMTLTVMGEEPMDPPATVNVQDFGATGDGVTNDIPAILTAIAALRDGDTLYFPSGTYLLHEYGTPSVILIYGKKNITIHLDDGATLRMDVVEDYATSKFTQHYVIHLWHCENVLVTGGRILGDRYAYTGSTHVDHGYAIRIADCRGVTVRGVEMAEMRGDGMCIFSDTEDENGLRGKSYDVTVEDCHIHDCFRNGITMTSVEGCTVRNTEIHGIRGGMPQAAIDIEAEFPGSSNIDVTIEGCRFYDNGSWSVTTSKTAKNITIRDCSFTERLIIGPDSENVLVENCELGYVSVKGVAATLKSCRLTAACFYGGEGSFKDCTFDGKDWITYRVLVTDEHDLSKGSFENCTFIGRGLSALGGCIVFCHTRPLSMEFTDCRFKSCGLIPFLGYLEDVEREGCFFEPGWALWLCILAFCALVIFLTGRHVKKRNKRVWLCK